MKKYISVFAIMLMIFLAACSNHSTSIMVAKILWNTVRSGLFSKRCRWRSFHASNIALPPFRLFPGGQPSYCCSCLRVA